MQTPTQGKLKTVRELEEFIVAFLGIGHRKETADFVRNMYCRQLTREQFVELYHTALGHLPRTSTSNATHLYSYLVKCGVLNSFA